MTVFTISRAQCVAFLAVAVSMLVMSNRPARAAEPGQKEAFFEVTVVDAASKRPIEDATVKFSWDGKSANNRTDSKGRCWLGLPGGGPKYFSVNVTYDGFVPMSASWNVSPADPLPEAFTMPLEPATTFSGMVRDEAGDGIPGVTLFFLCTNDREARRPRVAIWDWQTTTDRDGHWSASVFPAKGDNILVRLSHKDYISDTHYGETARPTTEEMRKGTGVMVMKKGTGLSGTVTDTQGKPILGASVALGSDRFGSNYPSTKTDTAGHFSFKAIRDGEETLTVTARGYSPDLQRVAVHKDMKPAEFKLEPGHLFKGRVVNTEGKPVANAMVACDTWRGNRSLMWQTTTDAGGQFLWDSAPGDEMVIHAGTVGYMYVRDAVLKAGDKDLVITLRRPLTFRGSVTDAETGRPIAAFSVTPGALFENDQTVRFQARHNVGHGADGKYEYQFSEVHAGVAVRIEADGYLPATSPTLLKSDAKDSMVFDAKLRKGTGPAGIVLLPDGKPAEGAQAVLCTAQNGAYVRNGRDEGHGGGRSVRTGKDGRFSFPAVVDDWSILALDDAGMAIATAQDLAASPEIRLRPWGTVKGTVKIGDKPVGGAPVGLSRNEATSGEGRRMYFDYNTTANAEGQFTFERVVPGEAAVFRQIRHDMGGGRMMVMSAGSTRLQVKAGETVEAMIGGIGRPVIGRLELPQGLPKSATMSHSFIMTKQPQPKMPEGVDNMTVDQRQAAWKKYQDSEEYQSYRKNMRHYSMEMQPDGVTFRVEDVEPGTYTLGATFTEPAAGGRPMMEEPVASIQKEFTVEPIPGGRTSEPLDLGKLDVQIIKRTRVGDMAPDIEAPNLDGKPVKLADFRGKYVLLNFWVAAYAPSIQELPVLKRVHDAYGKDDRLAIISLSLDAKSDVVKDVVQKNDVRWAQVWLGTWDKAKAPQDYGLNNIPSTWLIGPDGKVLARNLTATQAEAEVGKAIGKGAGK